MSGASAPPAADTGGPGPSRVEAAAHADRAELTRQLPRALAWAERLAAETAARGVPLATAGRRLAAAVGVQRPELIRIVELGELPLPADAALREAARRCGFPPAGWVALTLGYGILILTGQSSSRLLSHECRHVYQYETAGSIRAFLSQYLDELVNHGYRHAPLEIDARRFELDGT